MVDYFFKFPIDCKTIQSPISACNIGADFAFWMQTLFQTLAIWQCRTGARTNLSLNSFSMNLSRPCHLFAFLVIVMYYFSCSENHEQGSPEWGDAEWIVIDASSVAKEVDISDLIVDIQVFPLEEAQGGMLGDVEKVLLTEDYLLVYDRTETKKIIVFDRRGKFVKELEVVGEGPDKLVQIIDCWLNDKGNLEVYDYASKKVLVYGDNFEVQRAIYAQDRIIFHYLLNIPDSDGYVAFSGGYNGVDGDPFRVAFLDNELAVQHTALPFDSLLMGASISVPINPLFRMGISLRFYQHFDPLIYTVNPAGNLDVQYYLDYIHRPLPKDFERELILENLELFMDPESSYEERKAVFQGYTGFGGQWMESKDYVIFDSFDVNHDPYTIIYHKGKKKILTQGGNLREDQKYHLSLPTHFQAADAEDNRFMVVMPGFLLFLYLSEESPFYEQVGQYPETMFVMEAVLK